MSATVRNADASLSVASRAAPDCSQTVTALNDNSRPSTMPSCAATSASILPSLRPSGPAIHGTNTRWMAVAMMPQKATTSRLSTGIGSASMPVTNCGTCVITSARPGIAHARRTAAA